MKTTYCNVGTKIKIGILGIFYFGPITQCIYLL